MPKRGHKFVGIWTVGTDELATLSECSLLHLRRPYVVEWQANLADLASHKLFPPRSDSRAYFWSPKATNTIRLVWTRIPTILDTLDEQKKIGHQRIDRQITGMAFRVWAHLFSAACAFIGPQP